MVAYYCLHKFHWPPRVFFSLDPYEQAFVIAAIEERIKAEKEAERKAKAAKSNKGGRRR